MKMLVLRASSMMMQKQHHYKSSSLPIRSWMWPSLLSTLESMPVCLETISMVSKSLQRLVSRKYWNIFTPLALHWHRHLSSDNPAQIRLIGGDDFYHPVSFSRNELVEVVFARICKTPLYRRKWGGRKKWWASYVTYWHIRTYIRKSLVSIWYDYGDFGIITLKFGLRLLSGLKS